MKDRILLMVLRFRDELGLLGVCSLAVLVAAAALYAGVVKPAQDKSEALSAEVERLRSRPAAERQSGAGEKLASLYKFLKRSEAPTDWLAKLYGISKATGVEMQAANYKVQAGGKVDRYEITLPVSGSYSQIRDFVKRSLAEIPVLSIDQMSIKRQTRNDGTLQAELRLTLHLVKS